MDKTIKVILNFYKILGLFFVFVGYPALVIAAAILCCPLYWSFMVFYPLFFIAGLLGIRDMKEH